MEMVVHDMHGGGAQDALPWCTPCTGTIPNEQDPINNKDSTPQNTRDFVLLVAEWCEESQLYTLNIKDMTKTDWSIAKGMFYKIKPPMRDRVKYIFSRLHSYEALDQGVFSKLASFKLNEVLKNIANEDAWERMSA